MGQSRDRFAYEHHGMKWAFTKQDDTCVQHAFTPGCLCDETWAFTAVVPFQVAVAGRAHGGLPAIATAHTELPKQMKCVDQTLSESGLCLTYVHEEIGLQISVESKGIQGSAVIRTVTTATNISDQPITLTHLSSICMQGIALDGLRPWDNHNKIRVHYCRQTWAGEGQWREGPLAEVGLYSTASHSIRAAFHLSGEGSWSSGRYAPMIVVEDTETSQTWYAQIETSSPWHFELGVRGSLWDEGRRAMYLQADGASDRTGGWSVTLQPGESFASVPVAIGCCQGDFTDAVRELTQYRRAALKLSIPGFDYAPVIFNDYMNCLFAEPTAEKLIPLIASAASAGAEVYCIDAGWFGRKQPGPSRILGDWIPSEDLFGAGGLPSLLKTILDKGMTPGIWLEMEVCGEDAMLGTKSDDWFLQLRGQRVGGGDRWFLNFTNPDVRAYLHERIENLVEMGVGYIKNDYNACIGLGDDVIGTSAADGLIRNMRAFYAFIDTVRERHPKLILENCGCGAMRTDYGMQSHFHLASYSDQENYECAPSILGGSLATLLPEQLAIWAYPFPLDIANKSHPEILFSEEYLNAQADGEQTIFNMVNGLCGIVYLSGRIDATDDRNFKLIQDAIQVYKQERRHVSNAYPIWPIGMPRIEDSEGWASVGLNAMDGRRMLLAIWRREASQAFCELPLRGFAGHKASVRQIYPSEGYFVEHYYNDVKGALTVQFPKRNQARFFEICKA